MKNDTGKMSGSEQVAMMKALTQQAAGWLVGLSARTLRDHPDIVRDRSGRYDARELLAWAQQRSQPAELGDDDTERLLIACAGLAFNVPYGAPVRAMLDWLRTLRDTHGDGGCVAFVRQLITELEEDAACQVETTDEDVRQEVADRAQRERERRAFSELRQCHVCEKCGRLRKGTRWVKEKPPADYYVWRDRCPDCG